MAKTLCYNFPNSSKPQHLAENSVPGRHSFKEYLCVLTMCQTETIPGRDYNLVDSIGNTGIGN